MHKTPVSKGAWEPHPSIHPSIPQPPLYIHPAPSFHFCPYPVPPEGNREAVSLLALFIFGTNGPPLGRTSLCSSLKGSQGWEKGKSEHCPHPVHSALPQPRPLVHHLTSNLAQGLPPPLHIKRPSPPISLTHRHTDTGSVQTTK